VTNSSTVRSPSGWAGHDGRRSAASSSTRACGPTRVEWKHHFARLANGLAAHPEQAAVVAQQQAQLAPVLSASGWDDLAAIGAPLTLVRATDGYVSEAAAAEFARRLPGASVIEVNAGHNVQEYVPAELAGLVRGITA